MEPLKKLRRQLRGFGLLLRGFENRCAARLECFYRRNNRQKEKDKDKTSTQTFVSLLVLQHRLSKLLEAISAVWQPVGGEYIPSKPALFDKH
jgi:hypothetical protein